MIKSCPELEPFVLLGPHHHETIDFGNPAGVKALNRALLFTYYGITWWDFPDSNLCPPIPGRADYVHYVADLLPSGPRHRVLDIGVGANCIYSILGHRIYGWDMVGSDIDEASLKAAKKIVGANSTLDGHIELRYQPNPLNIFSGIIEPGEHFHLTICNPPFYSSAAEAQQNHQLRLKKQGLDQKKHPKGNFGGQSTELWCPGGELSFIQRMIKQSSDFPRQCSWFTTLVSKSEHLKELEKSLAHFKAKVWKVIPMAQGQKTSRILAWHF